jgi:hypothetical protein
VAGEAQPGLGNYLYKLGAAPGTTEQTKCENAERAVRKASAPARSSVLRKSKSSRKGRIANRTNVRQDSDVDICVMYADAFFTDYSMSNGLTGSVLGHTEADYCYPEFKNDVEVALVSFFGKEHVTRGNKAFDDQTVIYRGFNRSPSPWLFVLHRALS